MRNVLNVSTHITNKIALIALTHRVGEFGAIFLLCFFWYDKRNSLVVFSSSDF